MHKRLALSAASALAFAGCFCHSDDCMHPAADICVTDAESNEPLADAEVVVLSDSDDRSYQIPLMDSFSGCFSLLNDQIDEARIRVSAPGYSEATFEISISHDYCGDPVGQRKDVALSKSGGVSTVLEGRFYGCGS